VGDSLCNRGTLERERGRPEASLEWFDKARGIIQPIHAQDERYLPAREGLRDVSWGRAMSLTKLARYGEALQEWDAAYEQDAGSYRDNIRIMRANTLAHAGDPGKAVAEADALARTGKATPAMLYDAACVHAVAAAVVKGDASLRERYAGRAVALLKQLAATGYFKDAASVENMTRDPDFEVLRERDDYKMVVRGLAGR
jgi:hypothetical protein